MGGREAAAQDRANFRPEPTSAILDVMGFPEIMYLSKSQVRRLWPDLHFKRDRKRLSQVVTKGAFLPLPMANFEATWIDDHLVPPTADTEWPPWESEEIVTSIDAYVGRTGGTGTWQDLNVGSALHTLYKLSGRLFFAEPQPLQQFSGDPKFTSHILDAIFVVQASQQRLQLVLALENVAGVDYRNGRWELWESGASFMFSDMSERGFACSGLFAVERSDHGPISRIRAIYIKHGGRE